MEGNTKKFVSRRVGWPSGQRGFLLMETLLAIVFLTVGLTTVLRSYGSSLGSLRISADYTKALVLLERSLWPYESIGSIAPGTFSGEFSEEDESFQWEIEASEILDLEICETRATVSWERRGKVRQVSLVTYLKRE
jgi:hypothetical protein